MVDSAQVDLMREGERLRMQKKPLTVEHQSVLSRRASSSVFASEMADSETVS
jgi:hypothetical protein